MLARIREIKEEARARNLEELEREDLDDQPNEPAAVEDFEAITSEPAWTIADALPDDQLAALEIADPEPREQPPRARRRPGLMSESDGMALIRQYGYPQGKHPYDP